MRVCRFTATLRSFCDEQRAKERPRRRRRGRLRQVRSRRASGNLKPCKALFDRPKGPTVFGGQVLDRLACFVERTDVASLHRLTVQLIDPSQRKALGTADVRPLGVDATPALGIEKGASALGMRNSRGQQLGVATANRLGFDVEDREVIHAAGAATPPALETRLVEHMQPVRFDAHLSVQRDDGVGQRLF